MDLRQLAALVAISEQGSFSAAADALHTVQSNVSTHLRRLERELGAQLVDRAGGRLTEEGEVVVKRARRIHAELEALVADVAALREEVSGSVRIGVISSTARWLVPLLLRAVRQRHPRVRVVVVDASTTSLAPQVTAGQLDAAIVNLPLDDPDVSVLPLFEEDILVVAPADHPLTGRRSVTISDLEGVELLLPPPGTAFRRELDLAAATASTRLLAQAEVDGVRLIASMVLQGYGAAILPATAVFTWPCAECWSSPILGIPPRQVGLAQRRRGLPSAPARALVDVVLDVLGATLASESGRPSGVRPSPLTTSCHQPVVTDEP